MNHRCHPTGRGRAEAGAALLAVLWIVALLLGLVAAASLLLTQDLELGAVKRQVFRARMLGEAGLAIAMNPDIKPDDPLLRQQIAPDERVEVEMTGEDGLLNPNALLAREDRETFRRVFRYWGIDLQRTDAIIDALMDWVDGDDFVRVRGAESKAYGRTGMPFNIPFRSVEEMGMVRGMNEVEAVYPGWRSWFSVYAGAALDVNEARPEIISAVTGADIRLANQLRSMRLGRDGVLNTVDDAPITDLQSALQILGIATTQSQQALAGVLTTTSGTRRILVKVQVGDFERQVAAVVRGAAGQGITILWMGER
ncbi:MAG: type II secretion system protein GspK [Prosthecobacter sp.]|nr:type II secretion system protein GspK [Prosthecobacter sp.]